MPYKGINFEYLADLPSEKAAVDEANRVCVDVFHFQGEEYDACRGTSTYDYARGLAKKAQGIARNPAKNVADKPLTDSQKITNAISLLQDFGLKLDGVTQQQNATNAKLIGLDNKITDTTTKADASGSMPWVLIAGAAAVAWFVLKR